jgi:hypothetical protein
MLQKRNSGSRSLNCKRHAIAGLQAGAATHSVSQGDAAGSEPRRCRQEHRRGIYGRERWKEGKKKGRSFFAPRPCNYCFMVVVDIPVPLSLAQEVAAINCKQHVVTGLQEGAAAHNILQGDAAGSEPRSCQQEHGQSSYRRER